MVQTLIPSPTSKIYHDFNYFEDQKQQWRNLISSCAKFWKISIKDTNDLKPGLFESNQDHHIYSLSYDDCDLSTTYSVSRHDILRTYPFHSKKKYSKSNKPIFKFAYSTTHSIETKKAILKNKKYDMILLSDDENTPISNYSDWMLKIMNLNWIIIVT